MCIAKKLFKNSSLTQKGATFAFLAIIIAISTILVCIVGYSIKIFDIPDIIFITLISSLFFFIPAATISMILYNKRQKNNTSANMYKEE